MTTARPIRLFVLVAALASAGCGGVNRRFVIESNVPSAQVYIDNQPVGAAPAHAPFEYYGYYTITAVHPGYETYTKRVRVAPPWYAYPPLDFFADVLWPFRIDDARRYYIEMRPAQQTRVDDLVNSADSLRQRGWNLPAPERPAAPKVEGQGPGLPPPADLPPPATGLVVPSVQPAGLPPGGTFFK